MILNDRLKKHTYYIENGKHGKRIIFGNRYRNYAK